MQHNHNPTGTTRDAAASRTTSGRSTRRRALVAGLVAAQLVAGTAWASTAQAAASTERKSVTSTGVQANDGSVTPAVSSDGSVVAFSSTATNLANQVHGQVYVRNGLNNTTELASRPASGASPNGRSLSPSVSNDGRFVAFQSFASNLVAGDTNNQDDIFVKDRTTGAVTRVSVSSSGVQGNGLSAVPEMSGDGRYVTFASTASNLVPSDTNNQMDVFVHDRVTRTTTRASMSTTGVQGNGLSTNPTINFDGSRLAFQSTATNLIAGADTNRMTDVFVGTRTGVQFRASQSSSNQQGDSHSRNPAMSGDGRAVAFESRAANLVSGDTNNRSDIFHHDLSSRATTRVVNGTASAHFNDPGNGDSVNPDISHDGRTVAFSSTATNLVARDLNGTVSDVFVTNLTAARGSQNQLASVATAGTSANAGSVAPAITASGHLVTFASSATNLVAGDTNARTDVFTRRFQ